MIPILNTSYLENQ